jgi:hypothetical protein
VDGERTIAHNVCTAMHWVDANCVAQASEDLTIKLCDVVRSNDAALRPLLCNRARRRR